MKKFILIILLAVLSTITYAQQSSTSTIQYFPLKKVYDLSPGADKWMPILQNQKLPKPHPGTDEQTVREAKKSMVDLYSHKRENTPSANRAATANAPVLLNNFIGNGFNLYVPNDNDVAVSNAGFVSSVNNTMIFGKDVVTNQVFASVTLHSLVASLGLTQEEFDPKVLYDPGADRFILAMLNGFNDTTSAIILGFSQTNSAAGLWNFYTLPGDALNTNRWTDFPMMTVSNEELFITVNLLYNDSSWQTGFNQTIIWQIDKEKGYQGQTLATQIHGNINHNGEPIRNLCPVKGDLGTYGPGAWFLSNRNFSAGNDTIFLVHVTDTMGSPTQQVTIQALVSPVQYHMPVDADQPLSTENLGVNDARIMGAFLHNDKIQFVLASLDTTSGYDGIYHGTMSQVSTTPTISVSMFTVPTTDVAYPNIAYAGNSATDDRAVFSFLFSSATQFPGTAAAMWDGTSFSTHTVLRQGTSACNMLIGDERWGDYTGCQTRYNQPGYVWINGSYTVFNGVTRTWIGEYTVTTAAGVDDPIAQNNSVVYPNPSIDFTTLKFNCPKVGRITSRIYDNAGKMVHQLFYGSVMSGENEISFKTDALTAGLYVVIIADEKGTEIAKEKLVKR
ncbi:MAG: T9SS type A sorting domain-containing protein [Bacteroidetes bacterium]|nr:T9SS type A sorting domain-containing protein [Bacteroidota bacterium]